MSPLLKNTRKSQALDRLPPPATSPPMKRRGSPVVIGCIPMMPVVGGQPLPRRDLICPVLPERWWIRKDSPRIEPVGVVSWFCPPLDGAGRRAGRVRSPANSLFRYGKRANRGPAFASDADWRRPGINQGCAYGPRPVGTSRNLSTTERPSLQAEATISGNQPVDV